MVETHLGRADLDRTVLEGDPGQQPLDGAPCATTPSTSATYVLSSSYDGCATRCAKSPSLVSRISPSVSVSSRPTWNSRSGRPATKSSRVAPALRVGHRGDDAAGLVQDQVDVRRSPAAAACRRRGSPRCVGSTLVPSRVTTSPSTSTSPASISSSHLRRLATPGLGEQLLQPDQPLVVGLDAHARPCSPPSRGPGRRRPRPVARPGPRSRPCPAGTARARAGRRARSTPMRSRK